MTKAAATPSKKPAAAAPAKVAGAVAKPEVAAVAKPVEGALLVRTKKGVERRCRSGFVFGREPIAISLADIDDDKLEAILADPMLEVPQPEETDAVAETNEAAE